VAAGTTAQHGTRVRARRIALSEQLRRTRATESCFASPRATLLQTAAEASLLGRPAMFEELKHRIHSFRLPIRNKRVLFLVKTCYFLAPIALGGALMQWVTPDPEELRQKMRPPSPEDRVRVAAQKARLEKFLGSTLPTESDQRTS
jgi:hypothetical protein